MLYACILLLIFLFCHWCFFAYTITSRGRHSFDRMVVGFTTNLCNQCILPLMLWIRISIRARCITLCDKVCQWLNKKINNKIQAYNIKQSGSEINVINYVNIKNDLSMNVLYTILVALYLAQTHSILRSCIIYHIDLTSALFYVICMYFIVNLFILSLVFFCLHNYL
jgi:hypothetical protein